MRLLRTPFLAFLCFILISCLSGASLFDMFCASQLSPIYSKIFSFSESIFPSFLYSNSIKNAERIPLRPLLPDNSGGKNTLPQGINSPVLKNLDESINPPLKKLNKELDLESSKPSSLALDQSHSRGASEPYFYSGSMAAFATVLVTGIFLV
ncbi:hypothetical protein BB560_001960 [Smittium megazygosporum]|uniref:Uncharacterized protein n=1 Tax=Smittium megazygosporum TaxID=133381 RepID=A0A2T9ZG27_9FUNG|nr:hypothetical protein BB560_001960 [Smittium megazygosporum]